MNAILLLAVGAGAAYYFTLPRSHTRRALGDLGTNLRTS